MQERYTPGRYRDCRFCGGRGCAGCDAEADAAYKRAFPNGPQPLATFKKDDPADMAKLKECIGGQALTNAFSEGGGGMSEIIANLRSAGKLNEAAVSE
jgi:hypothetical protein